MNIFVLSFFLLILIIESICWVIETDAELLLIAPLFSVSLHYILTFAHKLQDCYLGHPDYSFNIFFKKKLLLYEF